MSTSKRSLVAQLAKSAAGARDELAFQTDPGSPQDLSMQLGEGSVPTMHEPPADPFGGQNPFEAPSPYDASMMAGLGGIPGEIDDRTQPPPVDPFGGQSPFGTSLSQAAPPAAMPTPGEQPDGSYLSERDVAMMSGMGGIPGEVDDRTQAPPSDPFHGQNPFASQAQQAVDSGATANLPPPTDPFNGHNPFSPFQPELPKAAPRGVGVAGGPPTEDLSTPIASLPRTPHVPAQPAAPTLSPPESVASSLVKPPVLPTKAPAPAVAQAPTASPAAAPAPSPAPQPSQPAPASAASTSAAPAPDLAWVQSPQIKHYLSQHPDEAKHFMNPRTGQPMSPAAQQQKWTDMRLQSGTFDQYVGRAKWTGGHTPQSGPSTAPQTAIASQPTQPQNLGPKGPSPAQPAQPAKPAVAAAPATPAKPPTPAKPLGGSTASVSPSKPMTSSQIKLSSWNAANAGKHGLAPFAEGFLVRCTERGMSDAQIKVAAEQASKVHPEVAEILQPIIERAEKLAIQVEPGGLPSRLLSSTVGQVGNAASLMGPMLSLRSFVNPQGTPERQQKHEESAKLLEQAQPHALSDTKVRLGGTDLIDDLIWKRENPGQDLPWYKQLGGRVMQNQRSGPLGKLRGVLGYPISAAYVNLLRAPHYNPDTDVAHNYWDERAVTEHELGHAIDFNTVAHRDGKVPQGWKGLPGRLGRGTLRDLYGAAYQLPFVKLHHEAQANRKSEQALKKTLKDQPGELASHLHDRNRMLPAAYGTYVGGEFGKLLGPAGMAAGPIAGLIAGKGIGRNNNQRLIAEQLADKKKDRDGDGKVNDGTKDERPVAKAARFGCGSLEMDKKVINGGPVQRQTNFTPQLKINTPQTQTMKPTASNFSKIGVSVGALKFVPSSTAAIRRPPKQHEQGHSEFGEGLGDSIEDLLEAEENFGKSAVEIPGLRSVASGLGRAAGKAVGGLADDAAAAGVKALPKALPAAAAPATRSIASSATSATGKALSNMGDDLAKTTAFPRPQVKLQDPAPGRQWSYQVRPSLKAQPAAAPPGGGGKIPPTGAAPAGAAAPGPQPNPWTTATPKSTPNPWTSATANATPAAPPSPTLGQQAWKTVWNPKTPIMSPMSYKPSELPLVGSSQRLGTMAGRAIGGVTNSALGRAGLNTVGGNLAGQGIGRAVDYTAGALGYDTNGMGQEYGGNIGTALGGARGLVRGVGAYGGTGLGSSLAAGADKLIGNKLPSAIGTAGVVAPVAASLGKGVVDDAIMRHRDKAMAGLGVPGLQTYEQAKQLGQHIANGDINGIMESNPELGQHVMAQLQKPENVQKVVDWASQPGNIQSIMAKLPPSALQNIMGGVMGSPMEMLTKAKDWFMSLPLEKQLLYGGGALAGTLGLGSMLMGHTGMGLGLGAAGAAAIGAGAMSPPGGYFNAHAQTTPGNNAAGGASVPHSQEPLYSDQGTLDPDAAAAQQYQAQHRNELELQQQQQ